MTGAWVPICNSLFYLMCLYCYKQIFTEKKGVQWDGLNKMLLNLLNPLVQR
ncbi:MAG: hypothetical protein ACI9W6_001399 [Motiliproteus sp.]|jgi:hypothetical protein